MGIWSACKIILPLIYLFPICSVVTEQCYPYRSGTTPVLQMKKGTCYMKGRGAGSPYCPRYQTTPPYRIANDVSIGLDSFVYDTLILQNIIGGS